MSVKSVIKRGRLIKMIEGVDPYDEHAIEDIAKQIRSRAHKQAARAGWASDLEQGFLYILIVFFPVLSYVLKNVRRSVRLSFRSIFLAICVGIVMLIELFVLILITVQFSNEAYSMAAILFFYIVQFALVGHWLEGIRIKPSCTKQGLSKCCVKCRCSLIESKIQNTLKIDVGPQACPQCNLLYPAIP